MDIIQHKLECQTKCGISSSSGTTFVPSFLRVHPDGAIFIAVSANKAVIQGFDIALNPIRYFSFPLKSRGIKLKTNTGNLRLI